MRTIVLWARDEKGKKSNCQIYRLNNTLDGCTTSQPSWNALMCRDILEWPPPTSFRRNYTIIGMRMEIDIGTCHMYIWICRVATSAIATLSTSYNAINQCLTVPRRIKSVDNDPYLVYVDTWEHILLLPRFAINCWPSSKLNCRYQSHWSSIRITLSENITCPWRFLLQHWLVC